MTSPIQISARLLPAVHVGGAWVSVEPLARVDHYGKPVWGWFVDLPDGSEFHGEDLAGWGNAREMLSCMLSFLGACAESRRYSGADGEHSDLFPDAVGAWAEEHSDDIGVIAMEIGDDDDE